MATFQELKDNLAEYLLGAPGSYVNTPNFKQVQEDALERRIDRAAEERVDKGEDWQTRRDSEGRTILKPTIWERLDLTGIGRSDATDVMSRVQEKLEDKVETKKTENYIKGNVDDYPSLSTYDAADGYKGARAIVKRKDREKAGEQLLLQEGQTVSSINAILETEAAAGRQTGLAPLDPTKTYTDKELAPYTTKIRKIVRAEELRPSQQLASRQVDLAEDRLALEEFNSEENRRYQEWRTKYDAAQSDKDRNDRMDLALLQFQGNQADRQYRREADERRDRRDDRKDRQLMILQLIKGLQQLGSGFAM